MPLNLATIGQPNSVASKSYVDSVTASLTGGGQPMLTPTAKTAAYTAATRDLVLADATAGAFTVTLPPASGGGMLEVKKVDATTNVVTVAAQSSDTVGSLGAVSVPIRLADQAMVFQANGTNWIIVDGYQSLAALDGRYATLTEVAGTLHVLVYASGAYPARPTGLPGGTVRYVGPVQPSTWLTNDEWINNS